jgi:peroxiredoxin
MPEAIAAAARDAEREFSDPLRLAEECLEELRLYEAVLEGGGMAALDLIDKVKDLDKLEQSRLYQRLGQLEKAEALAREKTESSPGEVLPLANAVAVLEAAGKREEAAKAFEKLRQMSSAIDLEAPPFQRLAALARELGWPADWRLPRPAPDDVGELPDLQSLGPFRWQPYAAADWTLASSGGAGSLAEHRKGGPVVLIFYLGHGCLHCVEQVQKFSFRTADFLTLGISLAAISSERIDELTSTLQGLESGQAPPPFPLYSDASLEIFKAYRAYDDFEKQPLHGTFLIDREGLVRWQDIGHEPFMEVDFLLEEAGRLLGRSRSLEIAETLRRF